LKYARILNKRILLIGIGVSLIIIVFILYFLVSNNNFILKPVITAGFDKFGIKETYPTKPGGEECI
jgi:hypothetical protein